MEKAWPVVIRKTPAGPEIPAFRHSQGGIQLVKGTIEPGETLEEACSRELLEESGLVGVAVKRLETIEFSEEKETWGFCLMQCYQQMVENRTYFTRDDGGTSSNSSGAH